MKEKAYLVESVRRGWLMNIINMYGLLSILPYYILIGRGMIDVLVYSLILISAGSLILLKASIRLTSKFKAKMLRDIQGKNIMRLAYGGFYGFIIPQVSLIFIPIMITVTMAVSMMDVVIYLKVAIISVVLFVLIVLFTYRNVRIVSANIHRMIEYLKSA